MRITDQYIWNIVFTAFFIVLVVMGAIIVDTEGRPLEHLTTIDFVLMTLATWRLIRLFVYDAVTKWLREQFYDVKKIGGKITLEKPLTGPRRTLADLLSCPWCFGVWAGAFIVFFYLVSDWAYYPVLFLALSAVASFLQLLSNLVGHRAEQIKNENERRY